MHPTQTGIATALALVVVIFFFVFNGMSLFGGPAAVTESANDLTLTQQTSSTTSMNPAPITELMINDEVVGTGAVAAPGDTVTVNYVGALTNGSVFDASANHPETAGGFTFVLGAGKVIRGWDQGIVGMKVGGKRMLAIPAALAYGNQAIGNVIPANSDLIFEVELLKVQKAGQ